MDITSDLKNVSGEVIYIVAENKNKVVGINSDGECVEVITDKEMGRTHSGKDTGLYPEAVIIRTINSEDHMIITGREFWCSKYKGKRKRKKCSNWQQRSVFYSKTLTTGVTKIVVLILVLLIFYKIVNP